MIYMICYDIADAKRLGKASKVLENYGVRIQKSFFQCEITKGMAKKLTEDLLHVINKSEDKLSVYPLCDNCLKNAAIDGNGEIIKIDTFEIF